MIKIITCQTFIILHFHVTINNIVPSKVWSSNDGVCHLYVGGFKSALNIPFLKENSIGLIVNAAYLLDHLYPPKTKVHQEFEKRRTSKDLKHIEEFFVNWLDDPKQIIKSSLLKEVVNKISDCIYEKGQFQYDSKYI